MTPATFPRNDATTLADDGDQFHFCSTCAFSQACLAEGLDKRSLGELHVLVGRGRDYSDVTPLRGVYAGPGASELFVSVEVTRVA